MSAGLAAAVAALAALLVPPRVPRPAGRRPVVRDAGGGSRARHVPLRRGRLLAGIAAGAAVALLAGGGVGDVVGVGGAVVGLVVGAATWAALGHLEPAGRRRDRELLERQAPLVVDLVAACLVSGATVDASVRAAASAVGDPAARLLREAVDTAALGAPAADAWRTVATHDALAGLARAVVRSVDTGAPMADVLPRLAARARARRATRAEARVRTAAVRLTGPLGLAFLPAFVLLGVVPVVVAWVGSVL